MTIRPSVSTDFEPIRALLERAGLPVEDFSPKHLLFVAQDAGQVVGAIGFEPYDNVGLLRSLIVDEAARGSGLGARLVRELESHARADGVDEIWLLTIDADAFFARLGYQAADRADAPAAIGKTREFSGLCPASAVLMQKRI